MALVLRKTVKYRLRQTCIADSRRQANTVQLQPLNNNSIRSFAYH